MTKKEDRSVGTGLEIAVIGMAGKFPGAKNIAEFWNNIKQGVESVSFFSEEQLIKSGLEREQVRNPDYVPAKGVLEDSECFDALFFGYTAQESLVMDPQVRILHECAWHALEDAGYTPGTCDDTIGMYAGASQNLNWLKRFWHQQQGDSAEFYSTAIPGNRDLLSTLISYRLDLKGPSYFTYTACSTSLTAIHLACRALLTGECRMALAGGITVTFPKISGYMYHKEMILAPDGHCRPFDDRAAGTVFGDGAGMVLLKRLGDALTDNDCIRAVILASAVNNDGRRKVGYVAPSVEGQAEVIQTALYLAGVEPGSIGYIETHGTGTDVGDTIEIEALKKAFNTDKKGFCPLGSLKANLGHLDSAAGVAGFIKTVLMLEHKLLPPAINFETPNPKIDFKNSPFFVNRELREWKSSSSPLRAGVSAFGIGGTNAHVILEEWSDDPCTDAGRSRYARGTGHHAQDTGGRKYQLILLSARTKTALDKMTVNLGQYFKKYPGINLANAAYTLQVGRKVFQLRRMLVCSHVDGAVEALLSPASGKVRTFPAKLAAPPVVFMFPGLGAQYVNMGLELYRTEPVFRQEVDQCFEILSSMTDDNIYNIKEVLYPVESGSRQHAPSIPRAAEQLVIFILAYALAKLLMHWGIQPHALVGYSLGEYTAACLAGIFSLEHALTLLVERVRLTQRTPGGAMLSVPLCQKELEPYLAGCQDLSLAIDNGESCIVAGTTTAVEALEKQMKGKRVMCLRLKNSFAMHSKMMTPILQEFEERVRQIPLKKPQICSISNVTGTWIKDEEAVDPAYWVAHLKQTVRFADGIKELLKEKNLVFLEVGPGHDLISLIARYIDKRPDCEAVNTLRPAGKELSDTRYLLNRVGILWLRGVAVDWASFHSGEKRCRIPLPGYPFDSRRLINPGTPRRLDAPTVFNSNGAASPPGEITGCFYIPSWNRTGSLSWRETAQIAAPAPTWLIFADACGLGQRLAELLVEKQQRVITVTAGENYGKQGPGAYTLNPNQDHHYEKLFGDIDEAGCMPGSIVHFWGVTGNNQNSHETSNLEYVDKIQELGFYSILNTARAISKKNSRNKIGIAVVTDNMQDVTGEEAIQPGKRTVLGPVKVLPLEFANLDCFSLDVVRPAAGSRQEKQLLNRLLEEFGTGFNEPVIAYRGNFRWVETFRQARLETLPAGTPRLREKGVYLITGGLGGIGLLLAEYLARHLHARLVLMGRSGLPPRHRQQQVGKIEKIRSLQKLGAEVLVLRADVTNPDQVEQVIQRVKQRFGTLHGVIHCAGLADGAAISLRSRELSRDILAPKVRGTLVLDRTLKDMELDFFVLCSSVAAIRPGFGQAAYAGANAFMDAFAGSKNTGWGIFTVSINWDRWINIGIAAILEDLYKRFGRKVPEGGITSSQGVEAFKHILGCRFHQVAVCVRDLSVLDAAPGAPGSVEPFPSEPLTGKNSVPEISESDYPHPLHQTENTYIAPQSETQQRIAETWQELFGIPRVGIDEDFFQLGGDSLKAIVILSKINQRLQVELGLSEVLSKPTIKELAQYIETSRKTCQTSSTGIKPVEKREFYRIPFNVKRLWIINQLDPHSLSYNMTDSIPVDRTMNREIIQKVLNKMMKRHEALRSGFREVDGEPVMFVREHLPLPFKTIDISRLPKEESKRQQDRIFADEASIPFDLANAPLFRVLLLKWAETRYHLIFNFHHIITDGWSMEILKRDFFFLYEGLSTDKAFEPGPLKLQYKDFSAWQIQRARKPGIKEKSHHFWLNKLQEGIPPLHLPVDNHRDRDNKDMEGAAYTCMMPYRLKDKLKKIAADNKTTLFTVLFAIYNIFLSKLTSQKEVVCSIIHSGREYRELDPITGYFVNSVIVKCQVEQEEDFRDFLQRLNAGVLETFQHQAYPYELVLEDLKMKFPDIPVSFNMFNIAEPAAEIDSFEPFHDHSRYAYFDLETYVFERKNGLVIDMVYKKSLFRAKTIEYIASGFLKLAEFIAGASETWK